MKIISFCILSLIIFAALAAAQDPVDQQQPALILEQAEPVGPPFSVPVNPDLYLIRPGDELQVTFIHAQLNPLTLTIDPEGRVIDRTLGVFDLANKTLAEAREILDRELRALYNASGISISVSRPRLVSVGIRGAVADPGIYDVYTSQRVSQVIEMAGGLTSYASRRWIIFSGGPHQLMVDLDRAIFLGDQEFDPYVYAGQSIFVPEESKNTVHVVGEVNNPREIELVPGDDLQTLLLLAGGVREGGDSTAIQVLKQSDSKETSKAVSAGDVILVPQIDGTNQNLPIGVFGAVQNQGFYNFNQGMTVGDALSAAGGTLGDANVMHTTVFRRPRVDQHGRSTEIRVPISDPKGRVDVLSTINLEPLDSIFVPVLVGFVTVTGEVRYPGNIPFAKGHDALYYIEAAGGFLPTADKERILQFNPISRFTSWNSPEVSVSDGSVLTVNMREELR